MRRLQRSSRLWIGCACWLIQLATCSLQLHATEGTAMERQVTSSTDGHILTNIGVWSPDGRWIVYDVRSDAAGANFDGCRIERVHAESGRVEVLYHAPAETHVGVVTYHPQDERVVFIHGPESPSDVWQYAAWHRRGVLLDRSVVAEQSSETNVWTGRNLDARDIVAPYTPGALRGGTHVHTFSGNGRLVAFTYEDHVLQLAERGAATQSIEQNQRNVGISVPQSAVVVPSTHIRNHDGAYFSVLVTQTHDNPQPGSNQISRAYSDAWVGKRGYVRSDGQQQRYAIAFLGDVVTQTGEVLTELFIVDIPRDPMQAAAEPLQGTSRTRPAAPAGVAQRRLTFTADRAHPGVHGVRHWVRSSPDGEHIAFLMRDDRGISQLWTISPRGGQPRQLTSGEAPVSSAFSWSHDGRWIAHTMAGCVCVTELASGNTRKLTAERPEAPLRGEACVFSPDSSQIAYVRELPTPSGKANQIFVVPTELP